MPTVLHTGLDECFHIFAADLAQSSDLQARNLPRPEQGIGGCPAYAEFLGELFRAQEFPGFFGLWVRKHPGTSMEATLPLHLVSGLCPRAARVVPLGSLLALRFLSGSAVPRRIPGPNGPIYSVCAHKDTLRYHETQDPKQAPLSHSQF